MIIEQFKWTPSQGWDAEYSSSSNAPNLILLFGGSEVFRTGTLFQEIRTHHPESVIMGCSTSGEIVGTQVLDDSLVMTCVQFEHSTCKSASLDASPGTNSYEAGNALAEQLPKEDLKHVFILSHGLNVNGSDLARGISDHLPSEVSITGGLAGDGPRFEESFVLRNGEPSPHTIEALGLYGNALRIGFGSKGGWDPFGPERVITSSKGNILYELDGKPALTLYKKYLGDYARQLPGSGLMFPLTIRSEHSDDSLVRTILSVDEESGSLTFAGSVPEGKYVRLMKANMDRLIDGAADAARSSHPQEKKPAPELALLISCVGRKMVLKQRVEEEIEGIRDVVGPQTILTGFYSYGEIAPASSSSPCELHNQTMTITTLSEVPDG